jgi:hypothetical protein
MYSLIFCIIFMLIGYYLGRIETDKKWWHKVIVFSGEVDEVVYSDGTVEKVKK